MLSAAAPALPTTFEWVISAALLAWLVAVVIALVRLEKTKGRREPMGQLGWAVAILCLPVIGAVCWFISDAAASKVDDDAA
ncbi:PLDc N-terminal domain-containing protein [Zhihengliuella flava]|uniref:Drug/metabolite transporter (DMT)-like permease n=1 Tax=Zhihengliuella flava TaxID=1285193 RepID=A0A931DD36_9MICC|nr:PLDc N-terminal domain-containing protein [Zhihengliuella flava]MBG6084570.1 drug/metabolite transporter (DMT)-like permease [Zhihengliuella flava]